MDKLGQEKHSQWMVFKALQWKICSKGASIIGKTIQEILLLQFQCMKYMEVNFTICWMIIKNLNWEKIKITQFRLLDWKNNLWIQMSKFYSLSPKETKWGRLMPPKQTTPPVEVMRLLKSKFKSKVKANAENFYWLILQAQKELRTARATIKIDKQKEQKSISLFWDLKNAWELLTSKGDKPLRGNMFHLDKANWQWFSEILSWQTSMWRLLC